MDALIQPPRFSDLAAIARNLGEVSFVDDQSASDALAGMLNLSRKDELVRWQVGAKALLFPTRVVRSICVETFEHMGNTFAGVTLVFDRSGKEWAYRVLSAHVTCIPWLEHVAAQVSHVIGVSVSRPT